MDAVLELDDFMRANRKDAIAGIVREVGQRLRRFIRARVANDADAEDILQDVWQRLVTTLEDGPVEQVVQEMRKRFGDWPKPPWCGGDQPQPEKPGEASQT